MTYLDVKVNNVRTEGPVCTHGIIARETLALNLYHDNECSVIWSRLIVHKFVRKESKRNVLYNEKKVSSEE